MGCGSSTFHRDETRGAGGPSYLHVNPLHRDFPWCRKGDPSSSKDLLGHPRADEDGDHDMRKSVSSTPLLPKDDGFRREPPLQTMKEIPRTKDLRVERPVGGDRKQDNHLSNMGDYHDDTDEEESDREDGIAYPSSPSFRGYCASPYDIDGDSSEDTGMPINEGKGDSSPKIEDCHNYRKDQNHGDHADPPKLPKNPTSSSSSSSRKTRRSPKQSLRAVLPKRNHMSGMKNLLHGSQGKSS
ncbi:hypothetical protein MLD38_022602 [Melastoma candidum]|uniref:Uncharacterized protein n=1 Tax=Melastoma candidum TaxID=119954 RepID=A0ACB9QKD2_9MYRT|nr:hypothetical protein MLD38_022602 [Melastoma candidum]